MRSGPDQLSNIRDATSGRPQMGLLAASMLWFKSLYEAVGLPKLDRMAIDRSFRDPSRLFLVRTANVDPVDDVAVRSDNVSPVLFHLAPHRSAQLAVAAQLPHCLNLGDDIQALICAAASLSRAARSSVARSFPGGSFRADSRAFLEASSNRSSRLRTCLARFRFLVRCSSICLPSACFQPGRPECVPDRINRPYCLQGMET
jgi:hypothetical protein